MNIKFDVAFTMNVIIVAMNIFTIILCYTFLYCSIAYVSVFSYVLLYYCPNCISVQIITYIISTINHRHYLQKTAERVSKGKRFMKEKMLEMVEHFHGALGTFDFFTLFARGNNRYLLANLVLCEIVKHVLLSTC